MSMYPQVPRGQELALDLLPSPAPSPANLLIPQQAAKPAAAGANLLHQLPSISVRSHLVTPSATWTELLSTTSYQTTITQTETSEVPILWRGKKIVTTIYDTNTQVVQATEIKTSSVLITPAPTWSTTTVTVTPSPIAPVNQACFLHASQRAKMENGNHSRIGNLIGIPKKMSKGISMKMAHAIWKKMSEFLNIAA